MKTSIASFIALCFTSSASASVHHLRALQNSAAWTVGYNDARDLWDATQPRYRCNELNDVVNSYWPDVKRQVWPTCESKYSLWSSRIQDCKDGAEAFTVEKVGDCVALSDCYALGDIAAEGVAGLFCSSAPKTESWTLSSRPPALPWPEVDVSPRSRATFKPWRTTNNAVAYEVFRKF